MWIPFFYLFGMTINKMKNKLLTIVTELPVHDDEAGEIVSEENKKQDVDSTACARVICC